MVTSPDPLQPCPHGDGGHHRGPLMAGHLLRWIGTNHYQIKSFFPVPGIVYGVWRGVQHCDCSRVSYYPVRRPARRGYIKMTQKHLISSR